MYLAGLWCSTSKPATFTVLEPIFKRLKTLEEGIQVFIKLMYEFILFIL